MGNLFEQSGAQIVCKIWWNNWVQNIVEKWVDNLAEKKLGGIIGLRNWVGKADSVCCTVYSKVVLLTLPGEPQCSSVCGGCPGVT